LNVEESYSELGLDPDCSDAEIKTAWRRLAARWHPDRNASPQALRKIQRINRAVEEIRRARASFADSGDEADVPDPRPFPSMWSSSRSKTPSRVARASCMAPWWKTAMRARAAAWSWSRATATPAAARDACGSISGSAG
jgi:hypothetical protein